MVSQRSTPRHWNAYRPSYSHPHPQQGPPSRLPAGFEAQIRAAPFFSRGQDPPLPLDSNNNPNLIPVGPHRDLSHFSPSPELDADDDENPGPQLWDTALNDLMGRTSRAYDLVINYERDSCGGERWSRKDIARVHQTGKELHNDIRLLKSWKRLPSAELEYDLIRIDVENVRQLCEYVQRVIGETEKKTWEEWKVARMQGWAQGVGEEMEYEQSDVKEYVTDVDGQAVSSAAVKREEQIPTDPVDRALQDDWQNTRSTIRRWAW